MPRTENITRPTKMEQFIRIQKTARYFSEGNPDSGKLLIALHGYGQLPQFFIRKFSTLYRDWHVVAPEGLHRFYINGNSGRVGASWMTKESRESDIEDNLGWIGQLVEHLMEEQAYNEIVLLGFSQGAATAARYFYTGNHVINRLIIWASVFPPDIDKSHLFSRHSDSTEHTFVLGTHDQFFTETQQQEAHSFFRNLGFKTVSFEGNHDIDEKTLEDIL